MRAYAGLLAAFLALVVLLAGCGGDGGSSGTTAAEEETTTGEATTPAADAGPIVFHLSGGIEGRSDRLVVQPDGTASVTQGEGLEYTEQLTAEEVGELRRLLDGSGLFTEDRELVGEIVDDFRYEVTYRGVTVAADSSAAPEALLPAIGRLVELLDSIAASGAASTEDLPPLELTLRPAFETDSSSVGHPELIRGHPYLQVTESGDVRGALSAGGEAGVRLVEVAGRAEGSVVSLDPGQVVVPPGETVAWDSWEMTLEDTDGDGAVDRGEGQARGTWTTQLGDVIGQDPYAATLTAELDRTEGHVLIRSPSPREFFLPGDEIEIVFDEPVRRADVDATLVLAGGRSVGGYLSVLDAVDGLLAQATFVPSAFLPFDTEVTIDLGGLRDPAGNAVSWAGDPLPTASDPGPLLDNPGFESGLDGWIPSGDVEAIGSFEGLAPAEGETLAVVREQSSLAGYLDVPADAEAVEFTVAVFSEAGQFDPEHSAVVALQHADGGFIVFDAFDEAGQSAACEDCAELGERVGPLRARVDLVDWRGQRVFLTVDVRSSFFFGLNFYAVVLDDFRLS